MATYIVISILIIWISIPVLAQIFKKKETTFLEYFEKLQSKNRVIEDDDDW